MMIRRSFLRPLVVALLVFFVQESFALWCDGTIYIKAPASWDMVTLEAGGMFPKLSVGPSGWYEARAIAVGQGETFRVNSAGAHYPAQWIDRKKYDIGGYSGSWSEDSFTCADLASGSLYIYEDPTTPGKTAFGPNPPNAKYFYVMIPPDYEEWMSSVPMISTDGGVTGKPLIVDPDKCGWYYTLWFNEPVPENVVLYRGDDIHREDMIGLKGSWETSQVATPIPLNMMFEAFNTDSLYFVPDEGQLLSFADDGWYTEYPEGVEGACQYDLAAIIYDTDASLHPAFSCYSTSSLSGGEGCQQGAQGLTAQQAQAYVNNCIGVTTGIVEKYLDPNVPQKQRKPKLSAAGKKCFINESFFNQLFNYTAGVNEKSCYNMPFGRSADGKWEFDSDFYQSAGTKAPGGFYPVETTDDAAILAADPTQTPVKAARIKRVAEGPTFYGPALRELDPVEQEALIDVLCNGPGWDGGFDCEGQFANGESLSDFVQEKLKLDGAGYGAICVLGWSCQELAPKGWTFFKSGTETIVSSNSSSYGTPRWEGERNQHFCFESHAKFTYKPGLTFNFRGDDDIWVYIDNTLAVDLGGTHLAAPAYVKLDNFKGYGERKLEVGQQYDIDIFFCDRRTTMSNVRIKTNMFIQQKRGLQSTPVMDPNTGAKSYQMCYTKTGDGSCASAMTGEDVEIHCCGDEILTRCGVRMEYFLVKGMSFNLDEATPLTLGMINRGGIDLTDIAAPKVDRKNITIPAGVWSLFAYVDGKTRRITTFRSQTTPDVMYRTPIGEMDTNGVVVNGSNYVYSGSGLAGELLPVYITFLYPDNQNPEFGPLYISPSEAAGMPYTLETDGLTIYGNSDGRFKRLDPSVSRTIGTSGVDTLYVMVDPSALKDEKSKIYFLKVAGTTSVPAFFEFFLDLKDLNAALEAEKDSIEAAENGNGSNGESDGKPNSSGSSDRPNSSNSNGHGVKPSFHIVMTGPFTFEIVVDGEKPAKQAYVVTDLNGNVVDQGMLGSDDSHVSLKNAGHYIVKIGHKYQMVKFK